MGFFVFADDGTLNTSNNVWIYPAVVVPLTLSVFAIWLTWIKFRPNKIQREIEGLALSIHRRKTVDMTATDDLEQGGKNAPAAQGSIVAGGEGWDAKLLRTRARNLLSQIRTASSLVKKE